MHTFMDLCFLCTKDYNCVQANEKIVSQVEYLLPEITIIKLGIPLRICSVCDGALCAFSKFKQSSMESSRRLEARIKGAQGPPLHTGSPPVVDDNETSGVKPEKSEEIFIKEEYVEQTPLDTNRASLDSIAQSETFSVEPHNQLHKDRVSQNIQLHTDTNADNIEQFFIKEEQIEETPQASEFYNNILKEECVTNSINDDIDRPPEHNTEDENATLNTSDEDLEGSLADSEEETVEETVCKKMFLNKNDLNKHMDLTSSKIYKNKNLSNSHMKLHSGIKEFRCNICDELFTVKSILTYHMRIHSNVKEFRCNLCDKSFTRNTTLTRHMKIHSGVKEYRCNLCDKLFIQKSNLTYHMRIHSDVKEFRCDICHESFIQKYNLTHHMRSHSGVKEFRCNVCDKSFARKESLNCHKKNHSNVKEFQCDVCDKSFAQQSTLIYHMRIHSGVKDFRCDVCDKSFTRNTTLTRHMKLHSGV